MHQVRFWMMTIGFLSLLAINVCQPVAAQDREAKLAETEPN